MGIARIAKTAKDRRNLISPAEKLHLVRLSILAVFGNLGDFGNAR